MASPIPLRGKSACPAAARFRCWSSRSPDTGFPPALFAAIDAARARGEPFDVGTDLATGHSSAGPGAFVNRYDPPRRLLIVGAVQIAQALAGLARELGIQTHVIDPRGRFLTPERFPGVTLDDRWPDEAVTACSPIPPRPW
jgi:xanthine dehydrogenase accessory factor